MCKKIGVAVAIAMVFFFLLEGICSSGYVLYQLLIPQHRILSGFSMQYDQELGWVSVPNFYDRNFFAPNIDLRTNSRGFRADHEFTRDVPPGKLRIICSGDSFTFGHGIGNGHTWCQQLEAIDNRLQTINMAESGYGLDQMYLRYRREGPTLDHDVHLLAFITEDFSRLRLTRLVGYGKPLLKLRDDEIMVENVPVPKESPLMHWLAFKPHLLRELRSVSVASSLVDWVLPARERLSDSPTNESCLLVDKMIEELQAMDKQNASVLVLVFLPKMSDYNPGAGSQSWRTWLHAESAKRGFVLIDLMDDFQNLPVSMKDGMFIWPGFSQYFTESGGHYDDQGHEWVAEQIHAKLLSVPAIAEKLKYASTAAASQSNASLSPTPLKGK